MNRVIQDGVVLHNVTVVITNGVAVVTPNKPGPVVQPQGGGGPGEETGGGGGP